MLYTISHAQFDAEALHDLIQHLTENDALVFWQDGVLLAQKSALATPALLNAPNIFALQIDVQARGIAHALPLRQLSLADFVSLTERHFPQIAL